MKAYIAMLDARLRTLLQYRAAALAGIGTQVFFGLVNVMIVTAFYKSSHTPQPMTYEQVVSYKWLGQAFLMLAMFGVENEIAAMIRSGAVAYELTRPVDLFGLWYARCIAARLAPTLLRAMPQLILAKAFLGLQWPASPEAAGMFLVAMAGSLLLASVICLLFTVSLLWTLSGEGVSRIGPPIVFFLSGLIIPLPLLPDWLQPVMNALPFRGLMDVPFRLYIGHMGWREGVAAIAGQWLWIVGLCLLGRWTISRGVSRLVIQGG